jgi:uncharacterized membrane protein
MMRCLGLISVFLAVATPHPAVAGRCGVHCRLPVVKQITVVPVTTVVEVAVPVAAVSFAYLAPPQTTQVAAPSDHGPGHFAAQSFDAFFSETGRQRVAGVLQTRCYSCHGQASKGNVRLWSSAGDLQPTKAGLALPKPVIAQAVLSGRMPPTGEMPADEKEAILTWAAGLGE